MAAVLYIGERYITTLEELRKLFSEQFHSSSISEEKKNDLKREIKTLFQDDIIQNWLMEQGPEEHQIAERICSIDKNDNESRILKLIEEAVTYKKVNVVRRIEDYLKLVSKSVSINNQEAVPFESEILYSTEHAVHLDITFRFMCVKSETERFRFILKAKDFGNKSRDINVGELIVGQEYNLTFRKVIIPARAKRFDLALTVDEQTVCEIVYLGDANLKFIIPGIGGTSDLLFTMIKVKGGRFDMSDDYKVTLSDYYIGEVPVTQRLWKAVMAGTKAGDSDFGFDGDDRPAVRVSWKMIRKQSGFLDRLNEMLKDKLPKGMKFQLPTEAQWEFAARGGTKSKEYVYSGSDTIDEVAWYNWNSVETHSVKDGSKKANELGIHDMSGNVWEWCEDWYDSYQNGEFMDPKGPLSGDFRVVRGGSWDNGAWYCAVSSRNGGSPDCTDNYTGFRLALSES